MEGGAQRSGVEPDTSSLCSVIKASLYEDREGRESWAYETGHSTIVPKGIIFYVIGADCQKFNTTSSTKLLDIILGLLYQEKPIAERKNVISLLQGSSLFP